MRIGIAGFGKMGLAIATRLRETGCDVSVWNRSADKVRDAGFAAAATPRQLAESCDIVLSSLFDAAAVTSVYAGADGLIAGGKGKLFIEMSTELPSVKTALAEKVRAKGGALVDCPVGGSTAPARQGKLLGLMGAEPADAARARPVLEQLCGQRLEECGPVGAGSAMKLAINLPLMVAWQAYGEAFAICRHLGWDPKKLLDLFVNTNGANNALKSRAPMIVSMFEGQAPGPTTFSISNACKDLKVMLAAAKEKGVALPAIEKALAGFEEARAHGLGDADGAALSVYWAKRKSS